MDKILNIFNEIPIEHNGLSILSEIQKSYYLKSLQYRYDNVLIPVYNKLLELYNNASN